MKRTKSMVYTPSTEARELTLYAVNTGSLYDRAVVPAVRNLAKKHRKGTFDADRAIDAFYPIATEAARMGKMTHGSLPLILQRISAGCQMKSTDIIPCFSFGKPGFCLCPSHL